jgi:hypothetical protein
MNKKNSENPAGPIARRWEKIHCLLSLLEPARFSFIVVGLLGYVFLVNDQGMEILRALGESFAYRDEGGAGYRRSAFFFAITLTLVSLANWYFPRLLLNVDFPGGPSYEELTKPSMARWRKWTPRILGTMPPLLAAGGFARIALSYEKGAREAGHLWAFSAGCLALLVALGCFFEWRRRWLENKGNGGKNGSDQPYPNFRAVWSDPTVGKLLLVSIVLAIFPMLLFAIFPVVPAQSLGGGAILVWGMATWVFLGSALGYLGSAYQFPSILVALVIAGIFSLWNDNHQVRSLEQEEADKPSVSQALDQWHTHVNARYPMPAAADGQPAMRPLFLVAAAGGGIRAAYWTALVLADLEDHAMKTGKASFAAHTFAISGVSGGALGAAVFDGTVVAMASDPALVAAAADYARARQRDPAPHRDWVREVLDDDFLAPALGRMLFPDFLQRFLPVRVPGADRATALELGWEKAWDRGRSRWKLPEGRNPLAENLLSLWPPASATPLAEVPGPVPHLLLNGTMVESGKRVLTSDLHITSSTPPEADKGQPKKDYREHLGGEFLDVESATDQMKKAPIRLSTAAHASARFTYVSPAGTFANRKHLVDGGYFENSGITTALDVLALMQKKGWNDVVPILIVIDNGPQSVKASGESQGEPAFFGEVRAPLTTMLSTREARGTYAEQAAWNYVTYDRNTTGSLKVIKFGLANRKAPLPLGWMLSHAAIDEMNDQLDHPVRPPTLNNPAMRDDVLSRLPLSPRPAAGTR